eukprot:scaffold2.g7402.t1
MPSAGRAADANPQQEAATSETTTQRIFRQLEERGLVGPQATGAGGATTYAALQRADAAWAELRNRVVWGPRPEFVRKTAQRLGATPELDVVVAGGTLGVFLAVALQRRGLSVAVVEAGPLAGRQQEWNISRKELEALVSTGVLTREEVEAAISIEFNPVRVAFDGSPPLYTRDVLNLGVSPAALVAAARARFEAGGGRVLERTRLQGMWIHPDGARLELASGAAAAGSSAGGGAGGDGQQPPVAAMAGQQLTAKLVVDAMGAASPVVRQVRWGRKPDGVCMVVGSCARGPWPDNSYSDIIATCGPAQPPTGGGNASPAPGSRGRGEAAASSSDGRPSNLQYFWESFPAGSGPADRTTYMFSYLDADPRRPGLEALMDDYWRQLPRYQARAGGAGRAREGARAPAQGVALEDMEVRRILFGTFFTFRDIPLRPAFDRVIQARRQQQGVGDAGGLQSPLSFGGFASLARHLARLTAALTEAVEADCLDARSLGSINAYNPGLSCAWMLQRAMSVPAGASAYDAGFINRLLGANFQAMQVMDDATLRPFLQDVLLLGPLAATLGRQVATDPASIPSILRWAGPAAMADWCLHFLGLAAYTFLHWDAAKWARWTRRFECLPPRPRFLMRRALEAWEYGSGADFHRDDA